MNLFQKRLIFLIIPTLIIIVLFILLKQSSYKQNIPTPTTQPYPTINTSTNTEERGRKRVCIQVITPAIDPKTGKCQEFPTPCDVPNNWQKIPHCSR